MQLSFSTRELREYCIHPHGHPLSQQEIERLQGRLADLDSADNLTELAIGPNLAISTPERIMIPISATWNLHCRIDHATVRRTPQGETDWARTHRILIDSLERTEGT